MAAKQENLAVNVPEVVLNSGYKMPVIGYGCGGLNNPQIEEVISIYVKAMEIGYRHFDTAALYGTEEALGKAVAKAVESGVIQSRDELFITSKLWITHTHHDLVLPEIQRALKTMGLEYLDLYLIHNPLRVKQDANVFQLKEGDGLPFDMHGTWKAMEDCCKLGLTKSIGVSNFSCEKISTLLENATIPPAVNQVEMNVGWQQRKLMPFCKEKGIHVCAYSPLGAYGKPIYGSDAVMGNQLLKDIAASKGKTISQVALRWIYEQGATPIAKSNNEERMKQNLQIFDWELTKEENDQILQIPQCRVATGDVFLVKNGPVKSVEELWDGDI